MSLIDFNNRVAVITGAGGGLGRSYALELARRGAAVVVNDLGGTGTGTGSSHRAADSVVAEISEAGGRAIANYDSVSTRSGGEAIIESALDHFGRIDSLINNAGFLRNKSFEDLGDEELDAIIDVHLKAAFYVSQPAYRWMKPNSYGRILFTSSASGAFGSPQQTNYGAAKAGLLGLMQCLAWEGKKHGVLVNAMLPTAGTRLMQEMSAEWYAQMMPQDVRFDLIAPTGNPDYVTPLAVYLVSERCQATQAIYSATGGRFARAFVGVGEGWLGPAEHPATVEDIEANLAKIDDVSTYYRPESVTAEGLPVIEQRLKLIKQQAIS
jgi:NAD(P)-dependent dehydrogenase (short-subunit alcohol dehydrogenase family)